MEVQDQKIKKGPDPLDVRIRVLVAVVLSFFLAFAGIADALYLTIEHYQHQISYCPIFGSGCENVLLSQYSLIMGVPISALGVLYYLSVMVLMAFYLYRKTKVVLRLFVYLATIGALFSVYLFYVQWFLVESFCFYCMLSAIFSASLFLCAMIIVWSYKHILHN